VEMPVGWLDEGGECHRTAMLRPLRGSDEEWLNALPAGTAQGRLATDLLVRCLRRVGSRRATRNVVRSLTVADRDYLVLRVWQATFGGRVELVLTCPRSQCRAPMDVDLPLDEIASSGPPARPSYPLAAAVERACAVRFRLPRTGDLEDLADEADSGAGTL